MLFLSSIIFLTLAILPLGMPLSDLEQICLASFGTILRSWGVFKMNRKCLRVVELPSMLTLMRRLTYAPLGPKGRLGDGIFVNYTAEKQRDRLGNTYVQGNFLYLAWYEQLRQRDIVLSKYLKILPQEMYVIGNPRDPTQNRIFFNNLPFEPLPDCRKNDDGTQEYGDQKGEVRPLRLGESAHIITSLYKGGKVLIHPRGSAFTDGLHRIYF